MGNSASGSDLPSPSSDPPSSSSGPSSSPDFPVWDKDCDDWLENKWKSAPVVLQTVLEHHMNLLKELNDPEVDVAEVTRRMDDSRNLILTGSPSQS